jgi:hypothetical protein
MQFQEEKTSTRKQGRSHVNVEKSSKNLISLFGEKPARHGIGMQREGEGGKITQNLITHQRNNIWTPDFTRR